MNRKFLLKMSMLGLLSTAALDGVFSMDSTVVDIEQLKNIGRDISWDLYYEKYDTQADYLKKMEQGPKKQNLFLTHTNGFVLSQSDEFFSNPYLLGFSIDVSDVSNYIVLCRNMFENLVTKKDSPYISGSDDISAQISKNQAIVDAAKQAISSIQTEIPPRDKLVKNNPDVDELSSSREYRIKVMETLIPQVKLVVDSLKSDKSLAKYQFILNSFETLLNLGEANLLRAKFEAFLKTNEIKFARYTQDHIGSSSQSGELSLGASTSYSHATSEGSTDTSLFSKTEKHTVGVGMSLGSGIAQIGGKISATTENTKQYLTTLQFLREAKDANDPIISQGRSLILNFENSARLALQKMTFLESYARIYQIIPSLVGIYQRSINDTHGEEEISGLSAALSLGVSLGAGAVKGEVSYTYGEKNWTAPLALSSLIDRSCRPASGLTHLKILNTVGSKYNSYKFGVTEQDSLDMIIGATGIFLGDMSMYTDVVSILDSCRAIDQKPSKDISDKKLAIEKRYGVAGMLSSEGRAGILKVAVVKAAALRSIFDKKVQSLPDSQSEIAKLRAANSLYNRLYAVIQKLEESLIFSKRADKTDAKLRREARSEFHTISGVLGIGEVLIPSVNMPIRGTNVNFTYTNTPVSPRPDIIGGTKVLTLSLPFNILTENTVIPSVIYIIDYLSEKYTAEVGEGTATADDVERLSDLLRVAESENLAEEEIARLQAELSRATHLRDIDTLSFMKSTIENMDTSAFEEYCRNSMLVKSPFKLLTISLCSRQIPGNIGKNPLPLPGSTQPIIRGDGWRQEYTNYTVEKSWRLAATAGVISIDINGTEGEGTRTLGNEMIAPWVISYNTFQAGNDALGKDFPKVPRWQILKDDHINQLSDIFVATINDESIIRYELQQMYNNIIRSGYDSNNVSSLFKSFLDNCLALSRDRNNEGVRKQCDSLFDQILELNYRQVYLPYWNKSFQ